MNILLTGGAGYIGTHTAVEFIRAGHKVTIVDNLSNSSIMAVRRVERLTNSAIDFHEVDLLDTRPLDEVFRNTDFDAVVHFAGSKAVGESVSKPLAYYKNNLSGSINLFDCMLRHDVHKLVFSSSATVYGDPERVPIDETFQIADASSPYGRTKLMVEKILQDICAAEPRFNAARLRYFNPAGAHESGEIGEDPSGIPNNLLPFVTQVAVGKREKLVVFGNDYPTSDGTCIRDYIHVVDLARGHLAALAKLQEAPGLVTYNLGTGIGYSVMDILNAFQRANNLRLPHEIGPRRPGDIAASFTDPALAERELGWKAEKTIDDICRDAWRWQQRNPEGYR